MQRQPDIAAEAILENLTTALIIIAADGSINFMNASAESLFGVSRNQVTGRRLVELLPGLAALDELIGRAMSEEQSFGKTLTFSVPHQERFLSKVFTVPNGPKSPF